MLEQQQICKELEGAIGHLLGKERILEALVLKPEQHSPIFGRVGVDSTNPGDLGGYPVEYPLERVTVLSFHILHNIAKIVPMNIDMLLRSGQRQAARGVWGEIAEVPSLQKASKTCDSGMLLQRAEGSNAQLAIVCEMHRYPRSVLAFERRLPGPGRPLAVCEDQKREWAAVVLSDSALAESLLMDERPAR